MKTAVPQLQETAMKQILAQQILVLTVRLVIGWHGTRVKWCFRENSRFIKYFNKYFQAFFCLSKFTHKLHAFVFCMWIDAILMGGTLNVFQILH